MTAVRPRTGIDARRTPRIALLNIGTQAGQGPDVLAAAQRLQAGSGSVASALARLAMPTAHRKPGELHPLLNPQRYNGACFVGLQGVVVEGHGSADAEGFISAIEQAVREVRGRIPLHLGEALALS